LNGGGKLPERRNPDAKKGIMQINKIGDNAPLFVE
jgi:hypothetical protein